MCIVTCDGSYSSVQTSMPSGAADLIVTLSASFSLLIRHIWPTRIASSPSRAGGRARRRSPDLSQPTSSFHPLAENITA